MRNLLGIVAGIVAGIVVQSAIGYLSSIFFPIPAYDLMDRREVAEAFASSPPGALVLGIVSYFLAALAAAWIASLIARRTWPAWVAAGAVALIALVIAIVYPEPAWAQFGAFFAALIGGVVGRHLVAPVPTGEVAPAGPPDAAI